MKKLVGISTLILVTVMLGILLGTRDTQKSILSTGQTAPLLDAYATPIYTEQQAISRTLQTLPVTITVSAVAARLISTNTLTTQWFEDTRPVWMPQAPIWLVGVLASGMTLGDTILISEGLSAIQDDQPVTGAFVAWDANDGRIHAAGELRPTQSGTSIELKFTYEKLLTLADEPLIIEHATALPTPTMVSTSTPTPTPQ